MSTFLAAEQLANNGDDPLYGKGRPQLDQTLLGDFHKVLQQSPLLWECYLGLPAGQRVNVDEKFLELIWQTILAQATAQDNDDLLPDKPLINILEEKENETS